MLRARQNVTQFEACITGATRALAQIPGGSVEGLRAVETDEPVIARERLGEPVKQGCARVHRVPTAFQPTREVGEIDQP